MNNSDEVRELLIAIRDTQREHLAEYRRVANRAVELQEQAVKRQEQLGNLYRRVVLFGMLLIALIVAMIVFLLSKLRL